MRSTTVTRRHVLLGGAAAGAVAWLGGCASNSGSPATSDAGWGGSLVDPPLEKPDVTLQTTDGSDFNLRTSTAGRLTLLFFGFTNCPDQCPVWLSTVARSLERIDDGPGGDTQVLFVGVDVVRDTPEVLDDYLNRIDPSFIGLTGPESAIAKANNDLLFPPITIAEANDDGDYDVGHFSKAVAFSPDNLGHRLYGHDVTIDQLTSDLPRLAQGKHR